jgi:phosphotransacetylase
MSTDLSRIAGRKGITPEARGRMVRTNTTVIAALAVKRGEADAMICGLEGRFPRVCATSRHHRPCAGRQRLFAAMS